MSPEKEKIVLKSEPENALQGSARCASKKSMKSFRPGHGLVLQEQLTLTSLLDGIVTANCLVLICFDRKNGCCAVLTSCCRVASLLFFPTCQVRVSRF